MVIDLQKIIDSIPYILSSIAMLLAFWLNVRKLKGEVRQGKTDSQKKAVDDALRCKSIDDAIAKNQKDVDMAHTEIRHLKESNSRIETSVHQINFEIKTLLTGLNEIKSLLNKNLTEIHARLDKHIENHIEGGR
jgi:septal ring factor EnvC (AmiA/AmiB activator)